MVKGERSLLLTFTSRLLPILHNKLPPNGSSVMNCTKMKQPAQYYFEQMYKLAESSKFTLPLFFNCF
ncbi:MAG: hypothetical protein UT24_C0010G0002 [Candidatus Woesebacteria bacterium GW2011_GWB1_39_12]|uniref:Uncharacterized protein n=2 Tax=Candidatus Woeseibacteriota TaxID=1752722 RepID=A0A0G0M164_9BACT|nr:MAG: hypothetical protein UT23_C0007G0051 [Candidatus Woesebacteria bacterium GW2011_GWA1_39_12]KKR00629.1 MAG: hypothetical protein UT24_C0010G0002 [Candidatus Woesebacteria bacterium GW2011_GWB1_39_12]